MYEHFDYKILYIFFLTKCISKLNFDFKKLINDIINHTAFIYFFRELIRNRQISFCSIGGVIVSMLALSTVDNGFETWSGQIKD